MSATKPVLQAAIQQYAKQLRLPTLGDQFARLAEEAVKEKQSHLSYLEALLEAEVEERDHRAMARRIQEAHFPAVKTLEEFDFQVVPHISVAVMRNLSEGGYLARKEPVIFLGDTGTGKTHLATALAVAACRQHKRVRFTTAAEMFTRTRPTATFISNSRTLLEHPARRLKLQTALSLSRFLRMQRRISKRAASTEISFPKCRSRCRAR